MSYVPISSLASVHSGFRSLNLSFLKLLIEESSLGLNVAEKYSVPQEFVNYLLLNKERPRVISELVDDLPVPLVTVRFSQDFWQTLQSQDRYKIASALMKEI